MPHSLAFSCIILILSVGSLERSAGETVIIESSFKRRISIRSAEGIGAPPADFFMFADSERMQSIKKLNGSYFFYNFSVENSFQNY